MENHRVTSIGGKGMEGGGGAGRHTIQGKGGKTYGGKKKTSPTCATYQPA